MSVRKTVASSFLAAISALVLLGQPVQGAGNSYFVAPNGNDNNNGSSTAPFRQIRKALSVVRAGDTVFVADGSYLGFNADNLLGSASAPITVKAVGTGVQVTPTTDRSDNRDNISINNSAYLVFDGINSSNATRAGVRVNTSDFITVRNGVYGNNAYWGIFSGHANDLLVENNECFGSQVQHGIYTSNSGDRPIIRFNRVHDNANCGIHMNGDASQPGDGIISGAVVEGNVIYNNGATGGSAINMDGVQDSIIRNNLLYNNHGHGIDGYQIDSTAGPKGLRILNNTVSMASDGNWAIQLTETAGVNVVRNNILYHPNTSRGGILAGGNTDMANLDSDYNMLDRATPDGGTAISLAQWQALGQDAHSITIGSKTVWVNAAGADFHLATNSAAIDKGTTLPDVTQDLDKNPRPSGAAYDLGCYEAQTSTTQSPPAAPTNLRATASTGQVALTWTASTGATAYQVERQDPGAAFVRVAIVSSPSYTDTGLAANTTYVYRVSASNSGGTSAYSATASATTPVAPPAAPASLTATASTGQVALSWAASTGATTYLVERQNPGAAFAQIASVSTTSYTDTGLAASTTYVYRVRASNSGGTSAYSPTASATTPATTPAPPAAPASLTATASTGQVALSWAASTGATAYLVERQNPGATFAQIASVSGTTYTDTGLAASTTYVYRVRASNSGGTSAYSPTASATTPATTTTFTVSGKVTVGTSGVGGVQVAGGADSTITAADGTYTLSGFTAGNYGIIARTSSYTFPTQVVSLGPSKTGVNFTAPAGTDIGQGGTYTVSGRVMVGTSGVGGVQVAGGASSTVTAADGSYTLSGFSSGNYGIIARTSSYTFPTQTVSLGPSQTGVNFTAPAGTDIGQGGTYTVSGTVTVNGVGMGGVVVAGGAGSTVTAADGTYTLTGFSSGNYGILASKSGFTFPSQTVSLGPSRTGVNFAGTAN